MKLRLDDTIAAIATPIGEGAISIVRLSGKQALGTADKVFRGSRQVAAMPGFSVGHGRIVNQDNSLVDEVLVTVFKEPHSYTGEHLVEFSCHGGIYVTQKVLECVLCVGARQADPGEFTKRAFLNGKMDLSQAEAVADLIAARSDKAQRASIAQLEGSIGRRVEDISSDLVGICSLLEIDLDLSEEGITVAPRESILGRLKSIECDVRSLLRTYEIGKIHKHGVSVAIVGRPNAGKSSLFNALLGSKRSIVSASPGTTRDFLEERIMISGVLYTLTDTAGLRESCDPVEAEGVLRTLKIIERSDVVLLAVDSTLPGTISSFLNDVKVLSGQQKLIVVLTKSDIATREPNFQPSPDFTCVYTSALTGEGVDSLRKLLVESVLGTNTGIATDVEITSARHSGILKTTLASLHSALESLEGCATYEFVSLDLRGCLQHLSEITGEVTSEDILNRVFSEFCVGK